MVRLFSVNDAFSRDGTVRYRLTNTKPTHHNQLKENMYREEGRGFDTSQQRDDMIPVAMAHAIAPDCQEAQEQPVKPAHKLPSNAEIGRQRKAKKNAAELRRDEQRKRFATKGERYRMPNRGAAARVGY